MIIIFIEKIVIDFLISDFFIISIILYTSIFLTNDNLVILIKIKFKLIVNMNVGLLVGDFLII